MSMKSPTDVVISDIEHATSMVGPFEPKLHQVVAAARAIGHASGVVYASMPARIYIALNQAYTLLVEGKYREFVVKGNSITEDLRGKS